MGLLVPAGPRRGLPRGVLHALPHRLRRHAGAGASQLLRCSSCMRDCRGSSKASVPLPPDCRWSPSPPGWQCEKARCPCGILTLISCRQAAKTQLEGCGCRPSARALTPCSLAVASAAGAGRLQACHPRYSAVGARGTVGCPALWQETNERWQLLQAIRAVHKRTEHFRHA